jgi:hypothetical protein
MSELGSGGWLSTVEDFFFPCGFVCRGGGGGGSCV